LHWQRRVTPPCPYPCTPMWGAFRPKASCQQGYSTWPHAMRVAAFSGCFNLHSPLPPAAMVVFPKITAQAAAVVPQKRIKKLTSYFSCKNTPRRVRLHPYLVYPALPLQSQIAHRLTAKRSLPQLQLSPTRKSSRLSALRNPGITIPSRSPHPPLCFEQTHNTHHSGLHRPPKLETQLQAI
jgi:hypothetical protein